MPCFRNSFLYGLTGGICCGLIRFMFTSRPKSACDFAVGSFSIITLAYWFQCRYEYSKVKFEMDRMKYQLQQHMLTEGTEQSNEAADKSSPTFVDV